MAETLQVRALGPEDDRGREALIERCSAATFFHRPGWEKVISTVMGHRPRSLGAFRGGELVGLLPMMACRGLGGRSSLISMPYAVYGGAVAEDQEVCSRLVEEAKRVADKDGVGRLELRCLADPGLDLAASDLYATFIRELPSDPEEVLSSIPKKARAEARKARERHELSLHEGEWYLTDLIRMFHRNKQALGSPGLPARIFSALMEEFGSSARVHVVRREREPIAAVMSFLFRDQVLVYYAGTQAEADRDFSASNFMYMAMQEWSVAAGFRSFDFGRSRKDSGAFSFKVRQGFEARDLHYRYYLVKDNGLPNFTPSNPKTRILRQSWQKLPASVARMLSTPLSKYLP